MGLPQNYLMELFGFHWLYMLTALLCPYKGRSEAKGEADYAIIPIVRADYSIILQSTSLILPFLVLVSPLPCWLQD